MNPKQGAQADEHYRSIVFLELLHDRRLVWTLKIRSRVAALESDPCLVGNCAVRILPCGPGESPGLWRVLRVSTEGHSRGCDTHRLYRLRDHVSERETRVESCRGVRLPR